MEAEIRKSIMYTSGTMARQLAQVPFCQSLGSVGYAVRK